MKSDSKAQSGRGIFRFRRGSVWTRRQTALLIRPIVFCQEERERGGERGEEREERREEERACSLAVETYGAVFALSF